MEKDLANNTPIHEDGALQAFFDALSDGYGEAIERCVLCYREMLWALLDYLPRHLTANTILELGCGIGNLSVLLAQTFPNAEIRLVDISPDSLDKCRSRLGANDRLIFEQAHFGNIDYDAVSFDLVVSSISLHHLPSEEKAAFFHRICRWLKEDGVFAYSDQFAGATKDLYERHMHHWKQQALALGSTDQEWAAWMEHQTDHDFHDSLTDQFHWLEQAGFTTIDCPWRYLLWTVVQARK